MLAKAGQCALPEVTAVHGIYWVSSDGRDVGIANFIDISIVDLETKAKVDLPLIEEGRWGTATPPNGGAIVYASPESSLYQDYLQPFPRIGRRYQIPRSGGAQEPRWSADASKVFYRSGKRIMAIVVVTAQEIIIGEPEAFFEGGFVISGERS